MRRWNLKITLKSDLCVATGEDAPGIVNMKTAMEHGVPYIPAKRIKGCLLEAGKEMRDNGLIDAGILECLFGKAGLERTKGIYTGDAHLCSVPKYFFGEKDKDAVVIGDYELLQKEASHCTKAEEAYLEEFFTRQRTRTAIDAESGTADKHSLRTIQVVPAGVTFTSHIEGELQEEEEETLQLCVKGLRHMGVEITRGFGEVQCVLEKAPEEEKEAGEDSHITAEKAELLHRLEPEEEAELLYEIHLDSPVVMEGEEAGGCLAGGQVLGALAGMYIKKFSLGRTAHENEDFRRIFLRDGVRFGYGFLKKNRKIYVPCPKAIARVKEDEGTWFNIYKDKKERRRKEIHGLIRWESKELYPVIPEREMHFHHLRPDDRGIAHALNDRAEDTSKPTGEFYQYAALAKGQTYTGTWSGKAKDLSILVKCMEDNRYRMRLGKSKTAEYGNCKFGIVDVSLKKEQKASSVYGTQWMLWLLTPMINRDEHNGEYTLKEEAFKKQLEEGLGCKVKKLQKIACSYTTYSGYNGRWRMPSTACPAWDVRSTFFLETDRPVPASEMEGRRWGLNIGKGCGQIAAKLWDHVDEGNIVDEEEPVDSVRRKKEGLLDRILRLRNQQLECGSKVKKPWEGIETDDVPPSSAISMLTQLLRERAESQEFYEEIMEEVKQIKRVDKKDRIIKFIEPCKGKPYEFMKAYLENAKWKARGRD